MLFSKEQIFIVTGASSGIGKGVAQMLNNQGATIIAVARRLDKLEEARLSANNPDTFFCEEKDLTENIAELPSYIKMLKEKYGKFSGLAYCAGISLTSPFQLADMDAMQNMFNINYFAPMMMLKGILDRRMNVGRGMSNLLIASISASVCLKGNSIYSGPKAALIASAKSIAREEATKGVRLNVISPADILTPLTQDKYEARNPLYPMGVGEVDDVANLACFLLSNQAKWITGQNYKIDCARF